jgi:hypothetical protein
LQSLASRAFSPPTNLGYVTFVHSNNGAPHLVAMTHRQKLKRPSFIQ